LGRKKARSYFCPYKPVLTRAQFVPLFVDISLPSPLVTAKMVDPLLTNAMILSPAGMPLFRFVQLMTTY
jgi:hypothetical protein